MSKYEVKKIDEKSVLISRDIQVGDKVIGEGDSYPEELQEVVRFFGDHNEFTEYKDVYGNPCYSNDIPNPFKIIGEISPEATWVKEGHEFDEDQLEFMFSEGSHAGISRSLNRIKELSNIATSNKLRVKVKGPCGHFH